MKILSLREKIDQIDREILEERYALELEGQKYDEEKAKLTWWQRILFNTD